MEESISSQVIFHDRPKKQVIAESRLSIEVKRFMRYDENVEVRSSKMEILSLGAKWSIAVVPEVNDTDCSSIFFKIFIRAKGQFAYTFKVSTNGVELGIKNHEYINGGAVIDKIPRKILKEQLTESGSCVFDVSVTIYHNERSGRLEHFSSSFNLNCDIVSRLKEVYSDPAHADFIFEVGEREFKVHKVILAAASPVMNAMFTTDMEENRLNKCKVDAIPPDIFDAMLRFIYYGNIPDNLTKVSRVLFRAAHYYQIEKLQTVCMEDILTHLCEENALQAYSLAEQYDLEELKKITWEIVKHDLLQIFVPMKGEPLPIRTIYDVMQQKRQEEVFWGGLIEK